MLDDGLARQWLSGMSSIPFNFLFTTFFINSISIAAVLYTFLTNVGAHFDSKRVNLSRLSFTD